MEQTAHLWLYAVMVFGIVLLPGLDMAFVMASSLSGGLRNGAAALGGIVVGGVCHVVVGALGFATLLQLMPMAFNVMLLAGAAYVGWIGWSLIRTQVSVAAPQDGASTASSPSPSHTRAFRQGLLTCLLNPKAYLFTLAVLPQFLKPDDGRIGLQVAALVAITAAAQVIVYGGVVLAADRLRDGLRDRPAAQSVLLRAVGGLLIATALYSAYAAWRGL
ncbi:LysE family translocator [Aquimonas sp.]|uniref:LysE family translocator n=1 Tax=Aquimonas sp. TaxID=1872588 RepID=UPI0037C16140